ncbi:hypothetical protein B0P06_003031 [Clostridium saccharoperbutylacetonicum]|uniref:Lipoprotein n=2 Tax=Clostridium TaxID=1485 RepID=M1MVJ2_9CLOT|nr:hypothetical protein [Clostridium saccharoperbutylacetonicum]AGF58651.1 hypothetical protein Cspa_c48980 [Clostridium saccharoperbutylacetonicum N1-4(HMT)]NRT60570.1 hypothetical protein [Clostridium saccharoperbutylacetonicum]NSB23884.1 hypothetical protein [Clostridium saccharoperbutylacetonicum]NSB43260.1 hypothetical protein [Clostridium saccharoperbutylacetonicum]
MMNKFEKKFKNLLVVTMVSFITISLIGLIGCESKELTKADAENKKVVVDKNSEDNNEGNSKDAKVATTSKILEDEKQIDSKKSIDKSKIDADEMNFKDYISLLGTNKEKLLSTLNEKPSSVDEGGVEFKKAAIRVWFDKKSNTQVDQVLIMGKEANLNGVKIGENISRFKEVFGKSISDKNGDAHFKYNGVFLSINYDTNTGETYAVYILKNDF